MYLIVTHVWFKLVLTGLRQLAYEVHFFIYSFHRDESVIYLQQASQLSETVISEQTNISEALQVGSITLGGRDLFPPLIIGHRCLGTIHLHCTTSRVRQILWIACPELRNTIRLLLGTDDVKQAQLADSLVII